jgi:hypothetical protein
MRKNGGYTEFGSASTEPVSDTNRLKLSFNIHNFGGALDGILQGLGSSWLSEDETKSLEVIASGVRSSMSTLLEHNKNGTVDIKDPFFRERMRMALKDASTDDVKKVMTALRQKWSSKPAFTLPSDMKEIMASVFQCITSDTTDVDASIMLGKRAGRSFVSSDATDVNAKQEN